MLTWKSLFIILFCPDDFCCGREKPARLRNDYKYKCGESLVSFREIQLIHSLEKTEKELILMTEVIHSGDLGSSVAGSLLTRASAILRSRGKHGYSLKDIEK